MISIFFADSTPLLEDYFFNMAYGELTNERKVKTDRLKFRKDKNLSVASQLILRYAIEERGYDFSSVILGSEKGGKPYVKNLPVHFSISHSGDFALCVLSDSPVGADIEELTSYNPGIAKRFFGKNEQLAIERFSETEDKNNMFFRIWTLKEAYSKMTGRGIGSFMDFEIIPKGECINHRGIIGCFFKEYLVKGYRIAIACKESDEPFVMKQIDLTDCIKKEFRT